MRINMHQDFDMIIHRFPKAEDLRLYFIADVHLGAREHMKTEWENFCEKVLDDPNAYLILGGDLINNGTKNSVTNIYDEVLRPRDQKIRMAETLKPLRKRILCALPGNHEGRSGKDVDDDPMYDILCKIDCEDVYRENLAFVKIQIGSKGKHRNPTYMLVVAHGNGGGILTGAAVNRNERYGYTLDGADALLVAHSHRPFLTAPGKIHIDKQNNQISVKPFKVIVATSWLSYGGYAARKMLPPTSHCLQKITLASDDKRITVEM